MKVAKSILTIIILIVISASAQSQVTFDLPDFLWNSLKNHKSEASKTDDPSDNKPVVTSPEKTLWLVNTVFKDIYVSIAFYDFTNRKWITKGWYCIKANQKISVNMHNYAGIAYVHGYMPDDTGGILDQWGASTYFCVDTQPTYEIDDAGDFNCSTKAAFSQLNINEDINTFTFQ